MVDDIIRSDYDRGESVSYVVYFVNARRPVSTQNPSDFKEYSYIVDPESGCPSNMFVSASVRRHHHHHHRTGTLCVDRHQC